MRNSPCTFIEARDALLKALTDYQQATLAMSVALQKVTEHSHTFHRSLHRVVQSAGPLLQHKNVT